MCSQYFLSNLIALLSTLSESGVVLEKAPIVLMAWLGWIKKNNQFLQHRTYRKTDSGECTWQKKLEKRKLSRRIEPARAGNLEAGAVAEKQRWARYREKIYPDLPFYLRNFRHRQRKLKEESWDLRNRKRRSRKPNRKAKGNVSHLIWQNPSEKMRKENFKTTL